MNKNVMKVIRHKFGTIIELEKNFNMIYDL